MTSFLDIAYIFPEIFLFIGAMGLLMIGAFVTQRALFIVHWTAIFILMLAAFLAAVIAPIESVYIGFKGAFIIDGLTRLVKPLIFLTAMLALIISAGFMQRQRLYRFEFPILMLFAACGMGIMVSAHDLITLYMGIELQSLTLYVMASFNRDSARASEAGLKYFVLGALASGILLYGCSLIYGFGGTTNFAQLARMSTQIFASGIDASTLPLILGLIFVVSGLAFKISAVPFHMWTPDVYEGAPAPITAFFATTAKFAGMVIFVRFLFTAFGGAIIVWQQIIIFLAIASMVLGAFAGIGQRNIKRLMAYSSIGHMGYALVGLAAANAAGVTSLLVYMMIYVMMTLACFACILAMRRDGARVEMIDDLAGTSKTHPFMAVCLVILMFSLAGIPPLAGFFGKFFVFRAAIDAELYGLAVIGVITSVIAAFYYLRIIKIIYIDTSEETPLEPMPRVLSLTCGILTLAVFGFFILPSPLVLLAEYAARSLFLIP